MDDRITLEDLDLEREMRDGFTAKYARRKAREIAGLAKLTESDAEDVAQDLMIAVLERREKFDPDVAHWNVFVTTIVEREVARILETQRTRKRGGCTDMVSLSTMVEDDEEEDLYVELGTTLVETDGDRLSGLPVIDERADFDWDHDYEIVLAGLTGEFRDICQRLRTRTISEVARDLGMTRHAVRHRVARIRERFEECGFGKMFE